ncbi:MAG TPA: zinc-ribbon domain-containing protein [Methylobacterium sp.]
MLIVCPACASEYNIDTDRVGAEGRSVRCAACRETWFITPDDVTAARAAEAADAPPESGRVDDQAALDAWEAALAEEGVSFDDPPPPEPAVAEKPPARARKKKSAPRKGMPRPSLAAGLVLAILASVPLLVIGRSTVVRAMPQSASLYARLGLPVNLRGLELRDVVAFQAKGEGGETQLVVEGDVAGLAAGAAAMPPIAIEVRDGQDQPVYRWTVPAPRPALGIGETARFRASLSAPPAQGRSVQVRFAPQADGGASDAKADASDRRP